MEHIRLQITKTKKEIKLLDHQLKVGDVPTGGCFLIVSTTKDNICPSRKKNPHKIRHIVVL